MNDSMELDPSFLFDSNWPKSDQESKKAVEEAIAAAHLDVPSFFITQFSDSAFFHALPSSIRENREVLASYIETNLKFMDLISDEREKRRQGDTSGLLGEIVEIPETEHPSGRKRRAERNYKISVPYLNTVNIDPKKVLFYRATQPAQSPKPEYYWTSDYSEAKAGLSAELGKQRDTAIILVADLETINQHGLIQDVNDDSGLAVRQISTEPFDQNKCLTVIDNPKG